jgi:hypothetical protein
MSAVVNTAGAAFKAAGWIVTTAPMASQLHSGCGYGWQGNNNNMAGIDAANFDGILLQVKRRGREGIRGWKEKGQEKGHEKGHAGVCARAWFMNILTLTAFSFPPSLPYIYMSICVQWYQTSTLLI